MTAFARPTVHLNGSGRDRLMEEYLGALDALRKAQQALMVMSPNGRDYYVQGSRAIDAALAQHRRRHEAIQRVLDEVQELAEALDGPAPAREPG